MNNDAFQNMVRQRASVKSTKEIAREAVEAEFKRKKKRRRGANDDYDSDSDDEKPRRAKSGRPELLFRPQQVKAKGIEDSNDSLYRDRAKERREGGVNKPDADDNTTKESAPDLIAPSSTKGLDFSLLKHQKQELLQQSKTGEGLDTIDFSRLKAELPTTEEAKLRFRDFVEDPDRYQFSSPGLTEYLVEFIGSLEEGRVPLDKIVCGVAGKNLRRSRLAMTMEAYPSNHSRAWEAPRELINPNADDKREMYFVGTKLLRSIEVLCSSFQTKASRLSSVSMLDQKSSNPEPAPSTESGKDSQAGPTKEVTMDEDEDDDDDIFGGLDEYVPPKE